MVYFAGHGIAWQEHFYLVPHDLGYDGPRRDIGGSLPKVLANGISDLDLEKGFEEINGAHMLLIIDACNSGKVLDSEEQRRGPINSKGLAQLAYEKGIDVLTAAQAYQAALESARLGHGYLTFALAEEGLTAADTTPVDGKVTAPEWFEYASRRVPQLQIEALAAGSRRISFEEPALVETPYAKPETFPGSSRLQTPRFYYRREAAGNDQVISTLR